MLQTRLTEVQTQLGQTDTLIEESFREKVSGEKPDGEHNRYVDMVMQRRATLQKEQAALISRLERVRTGLAMIALSDEESRR